MKCLEIYLMRQFLKYSTKKKRLYNGCQDNKLYWNSSHVSESFSLLSFWAVIWTKASEMNKFGNLLHLSFFGKHSFSPEVSNSRLKGETNICEMPVRKIISFFHELKLWDICSRHSCCIHHIPLIFHSEFKKSWKLSLLLESLWESNKTTTAQLQQSTITTLWKKTQTGLAISSCTAALAWLLPEASHSAYGICPSSDTQV